MTQREQLLTGIIGLLILVILVGGILAYDHWNNGGNPTPTVSPTTTTTVTTTTTTTASPTGTTATPVPLKVTSVDLSVNPNTITGAVCGSTITFTYTAVFHVVPDSTGGPISFEWTTNNGRSSTTASTSIGAGETTKTYTFTSSGTMTADHTFPGLAEVMVTAPNSVNSAQVQPTGACH